MFVDMLTGALARELGSTDRTIRRVAGGGTIGGRRTRGGHWRFSERDLEWLRSHWALLAQLRSALRVEPSVRAAILFGSTAQGTDLPSSDLDLIVELAGDDPLALGRLRRRLMRKIGRPVDLFLLADLVAEPEILVPLLDQARPIIDRDFVWPRVLRKRRSLVQRAQQRTASRGYPGK